MRAKSFLTLSYFLFALSLFGPFLGSPFLMDDEVQITRNLHVQDISRWPTYFAGSTMSGGGEKELGGLYYKPLMTSYYAVMWHFFGENSAAFRLPLLLLHAGSAAMLFLLFTQFFALPIAYVAGLVFLVHPANSEVVAYIADAQDVLFLFFGLAALLVSSKEQSWRSLPAIVLLQIASLLSKETGALFLLILPLYQWIFTRTRFWPVFISSGLVGIAYLFLRWHLNLTQVDIPFLVLHNADFWTRLTTLPLVLWHYIEIFFFPWRISVVFDFVVDELSFESFWLPLCGVLAFAAFVTKYFWRASLRAVDKLTVLFFAGVLLLWFVLHGNVIVPLDGAYADRWFYLAMVPALGLCALVVERLKLEPRVFFAVSATLLLALSTRTAIRMQDWSNPLALYQREYELNPTNAMMANNVGVEIFKAGDPAAAEKYFQRTVELNPRWNVGWNNFGAVQQRLKRPEAALEAYRQAISLGAYHLAYENYGALLYQLKRDDEARIFVREKALPQFPGNSLIQQLATALGVTLEN